MTAAPDSLSARFKDFALSKMVCTQVWSFQISSLSALSFCPHVQRSHHASIRSLFRLDQRRVAETRKLKAFIRQIAKFQPAFV